MRAKTAEGIAQTMCPRIDQAAAKEAPHLGYGVFLAVRNWSRAAVACAGLDRRLWAEKGHCWASKP